MIVEGGAFVEQVIGADDGRVASGVAAADPAFFQHRDVSETVLLRQVIGRPQSVPAAADDDGVVLSLWFRLAPLLLPAAMARQTAPKERKRREGLLAHDWRLSAKILVFRIIGR